MTTGKYSCPFCSYPLTDNNITRCPRCNHLLSRFPDCPGECGKCVKKQAKQPQKS